MSHTEDPRQTGRLAAYRFFIGVLIRHGLDQDSALAIKTTIRQALRGDLLRLNQTPTKKGDRVMTNPWPGIANESLGADLGGFGEGLKQGLEEVKEMVENRYPDSG